MMKYLLLCTALMIGCGTPADDEALCGTPTFAWTVRHDAGSAPATASIGRVPDVPVWPVTASEVQATVESGEYVALVDAQSAEISEPEPGVVRAAGHARWFVPTDDALPNGDIVAQLGGDAFQLVVDDAVAVVAPAEIAAPALSSTEGVARAHVDVGALPALASGWYEIAWSVDGGGWSDAAAWSGADFRLYAAVPEDGSDSCVSSAQMERGQSLAIRVRAVAVDGSAGNWSDAATIAVP